MSLKIFRSLILTSFPQAVVLASSASSLSSCHLHHYVFPARSPLFNWTPVCIYICTHSPGHSGHVRLLIPAPSLLHMARAYPALPLPAAEHVVPPYFSSPLSAMVRPETPTSSSLTRTLSSSSPAVQLAHDAHLSSHDLPAPHFPSRGLPCSSSLELTQLASRRTLFTHWIVRCLVHLVCHRALISVMLWYLDRARLNSNESYCHHLCRMEIVTLARRYRQSPSSSTLSPKPKTLLCWPRVTSSIKRNPMGIWSRIETVCLARQTCVIKDVNRKPSSCLQLSHRISQGKLIRIPVN
jgi:hypothetical protein